MEYGCFSEKAIDTSGNIPDAALLHGIISMIKYICGLVYCCGQFRGKENNNMKKTTIKIKLFAVLSALCMVLLLMPFTVSAAGLTVQNETELEEALKDADCSEIKLGGNIETTGQLEVKRTVTLDLNGYTLTCSSIDESILWVLSSGNLTVKDSGSGGKIDGQNKNNGFEVKGGILTLESGSIVNCTDADVTAAQWMYLKPV